jgi:hypothetical protein
VDRGTADAVEATIRQLVVTLPLGLDADSTCPAYASDGVTETWTGGCAADTGETWEGAAARSLDGEAQLWSFDRLVRASADGSDATAWDGDVWWLPTWEGNHLDLDLRLVVTDDADALEDGDYTLYGSYDYVNATLYVDAGLSTSIGAWWLQSEVTWVYTYDGCDNLNGWWQVAGETSAIWIERARYPDCLCGCYLPEDAEAEAFCRE